MDVSHRAGPRDEFGKEAWQARMPVDELRSEQTTNEIILMPILPENIKRYPLNWRAISNDIRFGRADFRCECNGECGINHGGRCNERHSSLHSETGNKVVLTVAHLDHQPENCKSGNLKAMCQRCHNRYDREHRNETRSKKNDTRIR
jgi:hypothetical protein